MGYHHIQVVILIGLIALGCQGERVYKVTTILTEPYLMLKNSTEVRGNARFEGFIADLLAAVATEAGFRYELKLVDDAMYGRRDSHGRWTGMIGELIDGTADMAAAALTRTPTREAVVDFSYTFQTISMTALMRKDLDITSLGELANQTAVSYGTMNHGSTKEAFRKATANPYRKMWNRMSRNPEVFLGSMREGLARVRSQNFALILEQPSAEYYASIPPCDLKTVGRFTPDGKQRSFGFAFPKRDPLLNDVNAAMLHLQDNMTIARIYRKWWHGECSAESDGTSSKSSLSYLLLLSLSVFIAAIVL